MDEVESIISSILRSNGIPLRAPHSSGDTHPDVPRPEDVDTGDRTRILKGIKQVDLAAYEEMSEEERKQYMMFVREESGATFGFVGIGNLKYTMVPEDIRGIDNGYFDCEAPGPDTGETPDTGSTTGDTGSTTVLPYLTFNITANGNVVWNHSGTSPYPNREIFYTRDSGTTWTSITSETNGQARFPVVAGEQIMFKGLNPVYDGYDTFSGTTATFTMSGHLLSMVYGDDFMDETEMVSASTFYRMFWNCKRLTDISDVIFPENVMVDCYASMFENCDHLLYATMSLPATNLSGAVGCYQNMFSGCIRLIEGPELPATVIEASCYASMFMNCKNLVTAPRLPASGVGFSWAYRAMFYNCTSLTEIPEINITSAEDECCYSMFSGCIQLDGANATIPITEAGYRACGNMFSGCSGMTTTPTMTILRVSGLSPCASMFQDCTNLVNVNIDIHNANDVNANSTSAFAFLFMGCTMLRMPIEMPGFGGSMAYQGMYKNCAALEQVPNFTYTGTLGGAQYAEMFKGCRSLRYAPDTLPATGCAMNAYKEMFEGCSALLTVPEIMASQGTPYATKEMCSGMFANCVELRDASHIHIYFTGATGYTFYGMFSGCTSLEQVSPTMLQDVTNFGTTTGTSVCANMFEGCTRLLTPPELYAAHPTDGAYFRMFYGCSSLTFLKCHATDLSGAGCTTQWLTGVPQGGTLFVPSNMVTSYQTDSDNGVPVGWDIMPL